MIGRGERFCEVGVYLSRDEDDELESLEKGGGRRIKGGERGERGEGGRCLVVGWLPNLYLSPLIPYEMRYMSMSIIMSMNMNTYENVSLAGSAVQVQSAWLFLLLYDR